MENKESVDVQTVIAILTQRIAQLEYELAVQKAINAKSKKENAK